jgi:hypothetical protein
VRGSQGQDLRTPGVLLLDGALATALALGFAARQGALARAIGCWWCVAYGLWSAAMFRLVPPMPTEHVLYFSNSTSPDAPFIVVAAVMHGLATVILAAPFARRVVHARGPGAAADTGDPGTGGGRYAGFLCRDCRGACGGGAEMSAAPASDTDIGHKLALRPLQFRAGGEVLPQLVT